MLDLLKQGIVCYLVLPGVTQELIDETRLSKEKNMLADLKMLVANQGDLEFRDRYGATPVSTLTHSQKATF